MSRSGKRMECAFCGKPFERKARSHGGSRQKYCSKECCVAASQAEMRNMRERAFSLRSQRNNYGKYTSEWMRKFIRETSAKYPPLTQSEERALIAENRFDRSYLNLLLVMHNVRLVLDIAENWCGMYDCLDGNDLFMIGVGAMWRAAQVFDIDRGLRFSTYAGEAAKHEIMKMTYRPEFLRERLSSSLDEEACRKVADDDGPDRIDVVMGKVDPTIYETPIDEWLEHRDMASFAREILDWAGRTGDKGVALLRRWIDGEDMSSIAKEQSVSRQRIGQHVEKAKALVVEVRDRVLMRCGERKLCRTTDWDRIAACAAHRRHRSSLLIIEHRGPAWLEGYIAFERYKLGQRHAARTGNIYVFTQPKGPVLTSNGFTATHLMVSGREFEFVDGKWRLAEKKQEESYGF